jgi:hypothetical protein
MDGRKRCSRGRGRKRLLKKGTEEGYRGICSRKGVREKFSGGRSRIIHSRGKCRKRFSRRRSRKRFSRGISRKSCIRGRSRKRCSRGWM